MRILLIESSLSDNGAIRVSLDRARRWVADGTVVTLLVTAADTNERGGKVSVPRELPVHFGSTKSRGQYRKMAAAVLNGLALARQTDVIVSGRESGPGLVVAAATSRLTRKPLAVTVQSNINAHPRRYLSSIKRKLLRRAELLVCVSHEQSRGVAEFGIAHERIKVARNGIDYHMLQLAARQPPAIPLPKDPFLVSVGRLVSQKGFDVLIRAHAAALASGAPPHSIVIVGEGKERAALEGLAAELGVGGSVFLPGFLSNPHAITSRAAAFVLASRWEGLPLCLAEALSLRAPVIATNCVSGPSEILGYGEFGVLIPVDDVAALSEAIGNHLRRPEILRAKAVAGSLAMEKCFDPADAAARHLAYLHELECSA